MMLTRGFLKDIGGVKRLRLVKAGYDANDLTIPSNAVVFDSQAVATVGIHYSGSVVVTGGIDSQIVTWEDVGYRPMVAATLTFGGGATRLTYAALTDASLSIALWSKRTGIHLFSGGALNYPYVVHMVAYRFPVT